MTTAPARPPRWTPRPDPGTRSRLFRILTITVPAVLLSALALATAVEIWVRLSWDPKRGSPGLFVSDPARGQRLAAHYDGWFAGVPVRTNNLGLRATRDYEVAKAPNTFRILVLGDSITFGHGSVHTYPDLLEGMLRQWRPDIDWQVWNGGVPGYNTSQELAHLLEVGPVFQPDLVIVGFYENDLADNRPVVRPGSAAVWTSRVLSVLQRHVYSLELYKKAWLQLAWRLSRSNAYRARLQHLQTEEDLLARAGAALDQKEQELTEYERLSEEIAHMPRCLDGEQPDDKVFNEIRHSTEFAVWVEAVRGLQRLHTSGQYKIVFFVNVVPPICGHLDLYYAGATGVLNDMYLSIMSNGTAAVSTFDAFLHRRPSQMPGARAHAMGNANMTKAEVLFEFLTSSGLLR